MVMLWHLLKVLEEEVFLNLQIEMKMIFCTLRSVSCAVNQTLADVLNNLTNTEHQPRAEKSFIHHKHTSWPDIDFMTETAVRVASLRRSQRDKHGNIYQNCVFMPTEMRKHTKTRQEEKFTQNVLTLFDVLRSVLTRVTHHAVDVAWSVFQYVVPAHTT